MISLIDQSTHRIIRNKIGLLNLAEELGNMSKACQMMGVSRDTFYRYQSARDEGGVDALLEKTRRKPNPKNRVDYNEYRPHESLNDKTPMSAPSK